MCSHNAKYNYQHLCAISLCKIKFPINMLNVLSCYLIQQLIIGEKNAKKT